MPMRGQVRDARSLKPGDEVPVQTEGGGLEVREVAEVDATSDPDHTFLRFTDGTSWAWRDGDPIMVVNGPDETPRLARGGG